MIEDTIQNLTAAINGLNETLRSMPFTAHLGQVKPAPVVEIPKVEANATIAKLKAQAKAAKVETPAPAPAPEPTSAPEPVAETTKKADLADLTILAQKCLDFDGLAALRELNAKHGIERISKTPDDKLAAVHADLVALYAKISAQ